MEPRMLELEITERALMSNISTVVPILSELQQLGIAISIDDFSAGQSSLNYLKRLPVNVLKSDKNFIADLEAGKHAKSIAAQ